jgi:hypothetical protein
MTPVKDQRVLKQFAEVIKGFPLFGCFLYIGRDFNTGARGKSVQRVLKIKVLALHHKLEDVTTFIALTKTAPRARLGPNHKRRRFLILMERTKSRVIFAGMAQFYTSLRDKVDDVYAGFDFVSNGHGLLIIGLVLWNRK